MTPAKPFCFYLLRAVCVAAELSIYLFLHKHAWNRDEHFTLISKLGLLPMRLASILIL
jgi:hypothetical protein